MMSQILLRGLFISLLVKSFACGATSPSDLLSNSVNEEEEEVSDIFKTHPNIHEKNVKDLPSNELENSVENDDSDESEAVSSSNDLMQDADVVDSPSKREGVVHSEASETIGDRAPQRSTPSLNDGGGMGGAISRLAGVIPLLASRLYSQIGNIRRRRSAEIHADASLPVLQQHHLNAIESLNHYYSSLTNGSKGDRPSPEDVKMHRRYLLNLLQMLRRPAADSKSLENGVLPEASLGPSALSSSGSFPPEEGEGGGVTATSQQFAEPLPDLVGSSDSEPGIHFASRIGEASSDFSDIQTVGVEEAALLLHQFQTQGNVNLLPQGFPGQPSPSAQQQQQLQQQQQQQQAMQRSSSAGPSFFQPSASSGPFSAQHYSSLFTSDLSLPASLSLHPSNAREEVNKQAASSRLGQPGRETSLPSSILDNLPDRSALIDRQNIPDLIEGLKTSSLSAHKTQSVEDFIHKLPADFFLNSNVFSDYESLINALRILQEYDNIQGTNSQHTADPFMSQSPSLVDLTIADPAATNSANQLYTQGYQPQGITALSPEVYPTRVSQLATTRLTTELNTAFQNLVENITKAITTFLTDLADAISENPALLLLGLIPFFLLILHLYHHYGAPSKGYDHKGGGGGGYGSGGHSSYDRLSFMARRPHDEAEYLARRILSNIDTFENWANTEFSDKES